MKVARIAFAVCFLGTAAFAAGADEAEDFQAAMEANNARWLQAYNSQDAEALGKMYAEEAILIAAGSQPIQGAKDIEASRRDLGFQPKTPIEEGLPRFVAWYREYHRL